ncbi:uncharacterized protein LOC135386243 [Ornithodoros turicata]|uniref:uncharacterized protein LOC135386243 n=1 Tax=Ornithodoros turicata TaxID=34597 RepID=UPI0031398A5A
MAPDQAGRQHDDEDDDDLSDDEVFVRGRCHENGLSKPLMAPRPRVQGRARRGPPLLLGPFCYTVIGVMAVLGIICLVIFVVNAFVNHMKRGELRGKSSSSAESFPSCAAIGVQDVWHKTLPMLTTETAFRHVDVNQDHVLDVVFAFGTGADAYQYPRVVCSVYFSESEWCGGGVAALNGKTGEEMWRIYVAHELFALNCERDLDHDGIRDCVAGGRMAGMYAISGRSGSLLWSFQDEEARINTSNVYTPQYIHDVDTDGVPDLVVVHGGDPLKEPGSRTRLVGRLMVVSGRHGRILRWVPVPDRRESYYSPQVLQHPDGTQLVLFGTGGETHGGSLWCIRLGDLLAGRISLARALYTDRYKGVMTPPALADLTGDGVPDIVMAMFNSTVVVFDGLTFHPIWSYHIPLSESYSTPAIGYFNDDSVPDVMINYQTGPGFPIYFYTQTTVLDGRTGQPLLEHGPVRMAVGTQASPLVLSVAGRGNDVFLYWVSDCHGEHTDATAMEFEFLRGTSVYKQSRADFCKLRFKEKLFTRMYAISRHTGTPGVLVYDSDAKRSLEYGNVPNFTAIGIRFLEQHPELSGEDQGPAEEAGDESLQNVEDLPYSKWQPPMRSWYDASGSPTQWGQYIPRYPHGRKNLPPNLDDLYAFQGRGMRRRILRHVGPHDGGGVQRTISTGALLPPLGASAQHNQSMDVVFATFWFYPTDTNVLLPEDRNCIDQLLEQEEQRFRTDSELYGMDHDAYEEYATAQCLRRSGRLQADSNVEDSYDPFNRLMGQMTVYRVRLTCVCDKKRNDGLCPQVLPFRKQAWPAYMGAHANGYAIPRV